MPTNWDSIPSLKIITAENITDGINDFKLVPRSGAISMGTPKRAMSMARMSGTFWFDTSNAYYNAKYVSSLNTTGLQLVARSDITALRPNINFQERTILPSNYNGLDSYDKANFSKPGYLVSQNSSGSLGTQSSSYIANQEFYYAINFTNSGTLVTQGNVVFTITIPNGLSCVLSGGQPIILHLRDGQTKTPSVAPTLVGNTLTITVTEPTNPYNISTNPAGYHISVKMIASLYSGWNNGIDSYGVANIKTGVRTAYHPDTRDPTDFYIKVPFSAPTITKINTYSTIPYNELFNYTLRLGNASSIPVTGIVVTDVLPTGITFDSLVSKPSAGWTVTLSGQTVTINGNSDVIPANYSLSYFTIVLRVKATGQNINISNTATVCSSNGFCSSATKTNYIDYDRTPTLTSQEYYTCSGTTYLVYRDINVNSSTIDHYYVNNVSVGTTLPSNGACAFYGSYTSNYYASGTKNNCTNTCSPTTTVVGSTVILNNGAGFPTYTTTGTYTSSISQADANAQAKTIADNAFYAGLQAKYNTEGYCTWTASNISNSYSQNFTRNNCGANCYGNGTVAYGNTQTATATSTTSCTAAIDAASTAAYNAAYAVVQANGQDHANAYGTCCCWVADPTCSGCDYLGNRERNTCDGTYRNTTPTAYNSCSCGQSCAGTYYTDFICDNRDKVFVQKYNCNGVATGATNRVNCGCDSGAVEPTSQAYYTCVSCFTYLVYRNTNRCSSTYNNYIVNGVDKGITAPENMVCNTTPDYSNYIGVRCVTGSNYDVYGNNNPCGFARYKYSRVGETNFTDDGTIFAAACTFSTTRSGTFTRNNCGAGYAGGSVSYSNTYYYSGTDNQAGANALADSNFNTDGQNYANSAGSCTLIPTCKVYDILAYSDGYYVDGYYTLCNGATEYFSFYASAAGTIGQTLCANSNSVYITSSGGGSAVQEAYSC